MSGTGAAVTLTLVATAISAGALADGHGMTMLLGLALCALGDVLLIRDGDRAPRVGMAAFLLGHVVFFAAFVARGVEITVMVTVLAVMFLPARGVVRWLIPHASAEFRAPIIAYTSIISVMVAGAAATFAREPSWTILGGAVAFMLSDLSVARDRFVASELANRVGGLPLYYGAQLLLALSVYVAAAAAP